MKDIYRHITERELNELKAKAEAYDRLLEAVKRHILELSDTSAAPSFKECA